MQSRLMLGTTDKAATLGILVAAVLLAQLPLFPLFVFPGLGNLLYACILLKSGVMAFLPFLLMKLAPQAAGFDRQWLPSSWWQWLGMLVLILLMFAAGRFAVLLINHLNLGQHRPTFIPTLTSFSRLTLAANGLLLILVAPIVEEIFWRGYVLEQLRKLMHGALALPLHAAMFAAVHFILSASFLLPLGAFFYGLLLGLWRIRFKSLLPLILAHVTINAIAFVPMLVNHYETLQLQEDFQATGVVPADFLEDLRSNPKCQQIAALTGRPAEKALPVLFDLLGDDQEAVRLCAQGTIAKYDREDVRPYLKRALKSARPQIVEIALLLLCERPDSNLREETRQVVWSAPDPNLQLLAVLTLHYMEDTEELQKIAEGHPNERARESARRFLPP